MQPEDLVRLVRKRIHASDPSVRELFAQDAVRIDAQGKRYEGRDAIGRFYESIFPIPRPYAQLEHLFANPPFVAAQLRLPERDGASGECYLDLFEVRDGAIHSVRVMLTSDRSG